MRGILWMARDEHAGGPRNAAELIATQREGGGLDLATRLDLDEGQHVAATRHDVDLAQPRLVAAGEDRIAGQPQAPDGAPFSGMAESISLLTRLGGHPALSRLSASARA